MADAPLAETRPAGPTPHAGATPPRSLRFAGDGGGFESELDAHIRERLRIATGFLAGAAILLFAAGRAAAALETGSLDLELGHPSIRVHLAGCLVAGACWLVLRRGTLPRAILRGMDAFIALACQALCVLMLHGSYETGIPQIVPLLGLLLVARAVVVPSRAARTLLLSLPALPAVLAIMLSRGKAYGLGGQPLAQESFPSYAVWAGAILGMSAAVAALASKVNFSLRLRAWEAKQVDRYTLEERIGMGGMGEIYRARHGLMRRPTAIKVLRPEIAGETNLARFEQEVRQTARLTHPNTIAIYDYGTTDEGDFYYAMELLDGADLERIVSAAGPLPAARVIAVLEQACGALAEAHGMGLVHRDLKPANIVLCRRGGEHDVVKVMDFGLVKDLRDGEATAPEEGISGTPLTMAPETVLRRPVTPAVDLYAVGAIGCYLLTGRPLFDTASAAEYMLRQVREDPAPPSAAVPGVPADLEALLMRCLRKDPAERPASAAALRADLLRCADAGRWTHEDARRWWEEHGAALGVAKG